MFDYGKLSTVVKLVKAVPDDHQAEALLRAMNWLAEISDELEKESDEIMMQANNLYRARETVNCLISELVHLQGDLYFPSRRKNQLE